ncbi:MAG TPA: translational GTPase TypA, partial [Rhodospirillaceae bacterium]|nr:translational GTPase TypA [Rhodospirillaceae bacterium]
NIRIRKFETDSQFADEYILNLIDTPGHADFGGEVERILGMVDGAIVLVDAAEGPLPQTKFVVGKALKRGLKPIVVINKVDRPDGRPEAVLNEVFDLFAALGADDEQLDFPILYASGRQGWASTSLEADMEKGMTPMFDLVVKHVPEPKVVLDTPFRMLATILEYNPYLGRILTGRITEGSIKSGAPIKAISYDGSMVEQGRVMKLLSFRGLERVPVEEAHAGDIVAIAGLSVATVADTLCAPEVTEALEAQPVDPPTLSMTFSVNNSPLAGREGSKVTSRMLRERLLHEAEGNVAIKVSESSDKDSYEVAGRGELQMGVLIETMRREGFELSVGRPRVIMKEDPETGSRLEPIEEVQVDVDEPYSGIVVQKMSERKAELTEMKPSGGGKLRLTFLAPTRGLIGYHGEFLTDTRGTGIMNRIFHSWGAYRGPLEGRHTGALISVCDGSSVAYALANLEARGPLFISPGIQVYAGMIVGEHTRENDLEINVIKGKQLTNVRTHSHDENIRLTPPVKMTLEHAISYIADDELVEVTPKSIRLRKRLLDPNERKRASRKVTEDTPA